MRRLLASVLPLSGIALLTSCLSGGPLGDFKATPAEPSTLGSFTVSSQVIGSQIFSPSHCTAGDHQFFLGADLKSEDSNLVVRLVVDPLDGPAVRVFSADAQFDRTVVFRRSDCGVFHFSLDLTGWKINDVYDYRLMLQLDCSRPGESVKGSVSTTHCH